MIFVDTGAFLARHLANDQYHAKARSIWRRLERGREDFVTSNLVLAETLTLLGRRGAGEMAGDFLEAVLDSRRFTVARPDEANDRTAIVLFRKYADAGISFTDAVSAALMRSLKIRRIYTFDRHFALMGFEPIK